MGKVISFICSAGLVLAFCFLITQRTYSQTSQDAHKSDSTIVATNSDEGSSHSYVKGITPMRARALLGVTLALTSLVVGWRARKRAAAGIGNRGRNGAIVALSLGAIAIVLSIIHLNIAAGAVFGSGSGKAGAIFALVLSLIGIALSILVLRQKKV
jgi:hypothetical protein